jgi:hypothetical protein
METMPASWSPLRACVISRTIFRKVAAGGLPCPAVEREVQLCSRAGDELALGGHATGEVCSFIEGEIAAVSRLYLHPQVTCPVRSSALLVRWLLSVTAGFGKEPASTFGRSLRIGRRFTAVAANMRQ